jgi:hypothetical protein
MNAFIQDFPRPFWLIGALGGIAVIVDGVVLDR